MLNYTRADTILAFNLWRNSIYDKYLGSALGLFWAIGNPLIMFALYAFVFGFVLQVRLPGSEKTLDFVVWLISGFGPWLATVEAIMAATTSITSASGMVKNMAFKTELLPISASFVGLITLAVSLFFLLIMMALNGQYPSFYLIYLPVVALVHFMLILSVSIWLSAINVFMRDLSIVLPNILMVALFMTPILYPIEAMPGPIQEISLLNPIFIIVEAYRDCLLNKSNPDFLGLIYVFLLSTIIFFIGLRVFNRVKGYFESVL
ncbi:MAG: ABC transporter permease [Gammaproteobacteria bacterium]